ncbi:MAG: hypothetical protein Q8O03_07325 [Nanoarchaeota archaeon]|jgi:hypothetical protein|nr:hypothetical protein [Nanoarchaeota archaeon]
MQVSFDAEKEELERLEKVIEILRHIDLEELKKLLEIQQKIDVEKLKKALEIQQTSGQTITNQPSNVQQPTPSCFQNNTQKQQPKLTSIQAQQAQAILDAASKVDMSKIYQSNAGIQKRREERYRHHY